jgi:hypothetical protein
MCIVCGKMALISASIPYPKGRKRRTSFDIALDLPSHVSDALPEGSFICGEHFEPDEIEFGKDAAEIQEDAIPSKV